MQPRRFTRRPCRRSRAVVGPLGLIRCAQGFALDLRSILLRFAPSNIIPGHDPLVLQRYPAVRPGLEGVIVRVDVEPTL